MQQQGEVRLNTPGFLQCSMSLSAHASSASSMATARTGNLLDSRLTQHFCMVKPSAKPFPSAIDTCSTNEGLCALSTLAIFLKSVKQGWDNERAHSSVNNSVLVLSAP